MLLQGQRRRPGPGVPHGQAPVWQLRQPDGEAPISLPASCQFNNTVTACDAERMAAQSEGPLLQWSSIRYTCAQQMSGTEGAKLVRAVITRLAQEGEEDWFGWVCCELTVQVGRAPFHSKLTPCTDEH